MRVRLRDHHARAEGRVPAATVPLSIPDEDATSERRLARRIRDRVDDEAALVELLRQGIAAWQRHTARIVLVRELGAERARAVADRAFGDEWVLSTVAFDPPAPATPGLLARWEFARARSLDELLQAV